MLFQHAGDPAAQSRVPLRQEPGEVHQIRFPVGYRNSCIGNNNNRGLESQFSRDTYVETKLDADLLPQMLEGRYRLVILSGNPGDGKTAFLQQLRSRLHRKPCPLTGIWVQIPCLPLGVPDGVPQW